MATYYDLLGLTPTATPTDIKKAYRELAPRFHPDKSIYKNDEIFKLIVRIYEILIDEAERKQYDVWSRENTLPDGFPSHQVVNQHISIIRTEHEKAKNIKEEKARKQALKEEKATELAKKEKKRLEREAKASEEADEIRGQEKAAEPILQKVLQETFEEIGKFLSQNQTELKTFPPSTTLNLLKVYLQQRSDQSELTETDNDDLKEISENLWRVKLTLDSSEAASQLRQKLLSIMDVRKIETILRDIKTTSFNITAINQTVDAYLSRSQMARDPRIFINILKAINYDEKHNKSEEAQEVRTILKNKLLLNADLNFIKSILCDVTLLNAQTISFVLEIFNLYLEKRSPTDTEGFATIFYNLWKKVEDIENEQAIALRQTLLEHANFDIIQGILRNKEQFQKLPASIVSQILEVYLRKLPLSLSFDSDLETFLQTLETDAEVYATTLFHLSTTLENDEYIANILHQCLSGNQSGPNRIFIKLLYQNLTKCFINYLDTQEEEVKQALLHASYNDIYDRARFPLLHLAKALDESASLFHHAQDADMEHCIIQMAALNEVFKEASKSIIEKELTPEWLLHLTKEDIHPLAFQNIIRQHARHSNFNVNKFQKLMRDIIVQFKREPDKIEQIRKKLSVAFAEGPYQALKPTLLSAEYYVRAQDENSVFSEQEKQAIVSEMLAISDVDINKKFLDKLTPEEYIGFLLVQRENISGSNPIVADIEKRIITACQDKNVIFLLHQQWTGETSTEGNLNNWLRLKDILNLNVGASSLHGRSSQTGLLSQQAESSVELTEDEERYLAYAEADHVFEKNYKEIHSSTLSSWWNGRRERIEHYWGSSVYMPMPLRVLASWVWFGKPKPISIKDQEFEKKYNERHPSTLGSWWNGRRERIEHYWGSSVYMPMPLRVLASWVWFGKPKSSNGSVDTQFARNSLNWTEWNKEALPTIQTAANTGSIMAAVQSPPSTPPTTLIEQLRISLSSHSHSETARKNSHTPVSASAHNQSTFYHEPSTAETTHHKNYGNANDKIPSYTLGAID